MDGGPRLECARFTNSCAVRHRPSSIRQTGCGATLQLSRGEALILVLFLSLGLWAVIWGALSLLALCGLR
jgi:hypothetical protein